MWKSRTLTVYKYRIAFLTAFQYFCLGLLHLLLSMRVETLMPGPVHDKIYKKCPIAYLLLSFDDKRFSFFLDYSN